MFSALGILTLLKGVFTLGGMAVCLHKRFLSMISYDILCYPMLPYAHDFLDSNLPVSGKESETRLLQFFYLQNFYETHGEPMVNQW